MTRKHTQEEIIEKFIETHGSKYDYSKVVYLGMFVKVCIVCSIHGEFWITPQNHIFNRGCPKCKADKIGNLKRSSDREFIEKAKNIYGDKNDYSKVKYINSWTKVCVTCLTDDHGDFWVTPNNHLRGRSCPICKVSRGEFIIKSILDKHNIKYIREFIIPNQQYKFYYDFYLPELNILIEFHGIQHFKYIPHFHRNEEDYFLARKIMDDIKVEMAKALKYKFLEFDYNQLEKLSREQFEQLVINKIKH